VTADGTASIPAKPTGNAVVNAAQAVYDFLDA
jgi:hypothetical protein